MGCRFLLQGNLHDLRVEPVSPALAGGFVITEPPGKSLWAIDLLENAHCSRTNSVH